MPAGIKLSGNPIIGYPIPPPPLPNPPQSPTISSNRTPKLCPQELAVTTETARGIVIYTHPDCSFSAAAKMDYRRSKTPYTEIDLSKQPEMIPLPPGIDRRGPDYPGHRQQRRSHHWLQGRLLRLLALRGRAPHPTNRYGNHPSPGREGIHIETVIPAQAGIQGCLPSMRHHKAASFWIPACAGMTVGMSSGKSHRLTLHFDQY